MKCHETTYFTFPFPTEFMNDLGDRLWKRVRDDREMAHGRKFDYAYELPEIFLNTLDDDFVAKVDQDTGQEFGR